MGGLAISQVNLPSGASFNIDGNLTNAGIISSTTNGFVAIDICLTGSNSSLIATSTLNGGGILTAGSVFSIQANGLDSVTDIGGDRLLIAADLTFEAGAVTDITAFSEFTFAADTTYVFNTVDVTGESDARIFTTDTPEGLVSQTLMTH